MMLRDGESLTCSGKSFHNDEANGSETDTLNGNLYDQN